MSVTAPLDRQTDCCRVNEVLSRVGERWTMQVVVTLQDQPWRFNDIKRQVGNISQQMLTRTLKALERDGMILRTICSTSPPQVEYALTDLGKSLSKPCSNWPNGHACTFR